MRQVIICGSSPKSDAASRERESSAAMVDVGDVRPSGPVAKGPMTDLLDLVVHPLQGAVGDADASPGEDPGEVGAKHPSQLLEGGKAAMARSPEPLAQMGPRPSESAGSPRTAGDPP
jgi:hypothetical protein